MASIDEEPSAHTPEEEAGTEPERSLAEASANPGNAVGPDTTPSKKKKKKKKKVKSPGDDGIADAAAGDDPDSSGGSGSGGGGSSDRPPTSQGGRKAKAKGFAKDQPRLTEKLRALTGQSLSDELWISLAGDGALPEHADAIVAVLASAESAVSVNLSENLLDDAAVLRVAEALASGVAPDVIDLDLRGNPDVTPAGEDAVRRVVAGRKLLRVSTGSLPIIGDASVESAAGAGGRGANRRGRRGGRFGGSPGGRSAGPSGGGGGGGGDRSPNVSEGGGTGARAYRAAGAGAVSGSGPGTQGASGLSGGAPFSSLGPFGTNAGGSSDAGSRDGSGVSPLVKRYFQVGHGDEDDDGDGDGDGEGPSGDLARAGSSGGAAKAGPAELSAALWDRVREYLEAGAVRPSEGTERAEARGSPGSDPGSPGSDSPGPPGVAVSQLAEALAAISEQVGEELDGLHLPLLPDTTAEELPPFVRGAVANLGLAKRALLVVPRPRVNQSSRGAALASVGVHRAAVAQLARQLSRARCGATLEPLRSSGVLQALASLAIAHPSASALHAPLLAAAADSLSEAAGACGAWRAFLEAPVALDVSEEEGEGERGGEPAPSPAPGTTGVRPPSPRKRGGFIPALAAVASGARGQTVATRSPLVGFAIAAAVELRAAAREGGGPEGAGRGESGGKGDPRGREEEEEEKTAKAKKKKNTKKKSGSVAELLEGSSSDEDDADSLLATGANGDLKASAGGRRGPAALPWREQLGAALGADPFWGAFASEEGELSELVGEQEAELGGARPVRPDPADVGGFESQGISQADLLAVLRGLNLGSISGFGH